MTEILEGPKMLMFASVVERPEVIGQPVEMEGGRVRLYGQMRSNARTLAWIR